MKNRQQIEEELSQIAPWLSGMELANPYAIPQGYFAVLSATIMERIKDRDVLTMVSSPANAYQVPAGYFEGLTAGILSRVGYTTGMVNEVQAELEELAPLLNTIQKENVYSMPDGYFTHVNFVGEQKKAKVFSLLNARRWMQYAAAAVITGVLVSGAFLFTDNNSYMEYEKYTHIDISSELNKVSEAELIRYLDNHEHFAMVPEVTALANEALSEENEPVRVLSDEELSQYLNENADPSATGTARTVK